MTLLTTGGSHQNPLIRRVRRHSTLAMLFRTPLPAALPAQRNPEPLLLGQPPRAFPQAAQSNAPMGSEPPLFPAEAPADQPAAPIQDVIDLPTLTPVARAQSVATPIPIAAAQPAIAALPAPVTPPVQRTMTMPLSEPVTSPLPGAVAVPMRASAPPAPALPVATGSAPQSSPPRIASQSLAAQAVLPVTQTIPPPAPTTATPSPMPVQRSAVEPAADAIDALTWRRLQAAYNRYREREATGDWPPSATTTSAAAAQSLFAARRAAPLRPAPPAQAPPSVVQSYPKDAPVAQEQSPLPLDATRATHSQSATAIDQPTAPVTAAAQTVIQPALVDPPISNAPASPPSLTALPPVQNDLTPSPLAPPPATPMPAGLAQEGVVQRAALPTAAPQTPAATLLPAPASLSAEPPDNQRASAMASAPMLLEHSSPNRLSDAEVLMETVAVDTPPLEVVWPVHQATATMTGAPGLAPPMVQRQPASPASLSPVATHVEAAPPLAPQVHERLTAPQTARPTESKVDVVMPRRPRPSLPGAAQPPTTAPVAQRTEAPGSQPAAAQPTPVVASPAAPAAQTADFPMIETEIGPLPADLWTLVGVAPPRPLTSAQSASVVARALTDASPSLTSATVAAPAPSLRRTDDSAGLSPLPTLTATQTPVPDRATPTPVLTEQASLVAPTAAPDVRPDLPLANMVQRTAALPDIVQTPAIAAAEAVPVDKSGTSSSLSLPVAQGDNRSPAGDEAAVTTPLPTVAQPAGATDAVSLPPHRPLITLQRQPEPADLAPPGEPAAPPGVDADEVAAKKKRRKPSTPTKSPARSTRSSAAN